MADKVMREQCQFPDNTIRLAEHMVFSDGFKPLYREGMDLVEEAAAYLDGEGRELARGLSTAAATLYASESLRLTTRLMQIASWLLLQRAARNGDMRPEMIEAERAKVILDTPSAGEQAEGWSELPERFVELVDHSLRLQSRVQRTEREVYGQDRNNIAQAVNGNPVSEQITLLRTALGAR